MKKPPRVLVVDDERFFREAVRDALKDLPARCEQAETGEEALKLAMDPGIEAVVLDVRLPGTSGIEVLRALREQRSTLRVIVLSAHTDQALVLEALRLGAADYLAKPIHDEELRLAVSRAVEGTRLANRWESLCARLFHLAEGCASLALPAGEGTLPERLASLADPVITLLAESLGAARASLLIGDREALRVVAIVGGDIADEDLPAATALEGVAGLAFGADRVLRFEDIDRDERCAGRSRRGRYATSQALLAPLFIRGDAAGVVCVADPNPERPFGDEDISLLRLFATQLGGLLGAEALHPAEADSAPPDPIPAGDPDEMQRADLLRAACEAMTSEVEPQAVLSRTLEAIAEALSALASLYLVDGKTGELVLEACRDAGDRAEPLRLSCDRGLTSLALRSGRLVATGRPEEDARFDAEADTPEDDIPGPLMVLPLCIRGKVLGVARIHPDREADASARNGELLSAALSAALRNALLYRSLLEAIEDVAAARRDAGSR